MTGPLPCDHCRGVHFCAYIRGPFPATLILECTSCRARTACRITAPVMEEAAS